MFFFIVSMLFDKTIYQRIVETMKIFLAGKGTEKNTTSFILLCVGSKLGGRGGKEQKLMFICGFSILADAFFVDNKQREK